MPTELRHLLFDSTEVVHAVTEYRRRMSNPLPAGTILECGPQQKSGGPTYFYLTVSPDCGGRLFFGDATRAKPVPFLIDGSELSEALMLFCRVNRIPLAVSAQKIVSILHGQICLIATIERQKNVLAKFK